MEKPSLSSIRVFLNETREILERYTEIISQAVNTGFNVFTMVSDMYYRENFHSDVIASFLNPHGAHGEGDLFLRQFIEMLGVKSNLYDTATTIEREYYVKKNNGRIDILIKNNNPNDPHCIIIENKLNDAVDMNNQLIRYYNELADLEGYGKKGVDKIVYIPLSPTKYPTHTNETIEEKLCIVPANDYRVNNLSLVKSWIEPCIKNANNIDSISILRQYKRLLINLKPEIEANMEVNDFINLLKENQDCFNSVLAIQKILSDNIKKCLAQRLCNDIKGHSSIDRYEGVVIKLKDNQQVYVYSWVGDEAQYMVKILKDGQLTDSPAIPEELRKVLKVGKNPENKSETVFLFNLNEEDTLKQFLKDLIKYDITNS